MQRRSRTPLELAGELWSRRGWAAVLTFCGVFTIAASVTLALPDLYRATVTLVVERQRQDPGSTPTGELETRLHTVSQEILRRSHLMALIERFGLYPKLRDRAPAETLVEQMRRDLTLEPSEVSQPWGRVATVGFILSYRGRDPETVAAVANAVAALYVEEDVKLRERQAARTTASLQAQLEDAKKQLDAHEHQVAEFKKLHVGELPQQMEANLSTLERLNAQLRLVSDNLARNTERRASLLREMGERSAPKVGANPVADRLILLRQELLALRQGHTDRYPDVARLKGEVAELERQSAELERQSAERHSTTGDTQNRAAEELPQIEREIHALKAEEQNLKGALDEYQRRVEKAPQREQEFLALARDYAATKALYESLLKRYEESQISEAGGEPSSTERFRILDPAIVPREPVAPNRLRLLLMGVVLALGVAAGVVVLADQSDTSFHSVDDVRVFTRVPVLASIPPITTRRDTWRRRMRVVATTLAVVLGLALLAGASYLMAVGNDEIVLLLSRGRS